MRRLLDFVVRNWPLKLAAIGLATVLYAGVVLSGNDRTWPGQVPIEIVDPPAGGVLLDAPGSVGQIRYRAPLEVAGRLTGDAFRATIDLSGLSPAPGAPPQEAIVRVVSLVPGVEVVDFQPRSLPVRLDSVVTRSIPVTVSSGEAPPGFVLGPPQLDPPLVTIRGATSRLAQVAQARVRVPVDASGLNIDQSLDVEVVDPSGNLVPGVEVMPGRVGVRIDVARQLTYASVPVVADVSGAVAAGHRVSGVTTDPVTVTVSGEGDALGRLVSIATMPIDIAGATADRVVDTSLVLPPDVTLIGDPGVRVTIGVVADEGSRTQEVGVTPVGGRRDRVVTLSAPSVQVTLGGPLAALDTTVPGMVRAEVDLAGLPIGRHEVPVRVIAPDDLTVIAVAPDTLVVRIATAPPASSPSPDEPTPAPSAAAAAAAASVPPSVVLGAAASRDAVPVGRPLTPMPRLFGTDGIRGIANVELRPPLAYALGRATAAHLLSGGGTLLVGQDTRRSGDMLVAAIVAGATSMGTDVHRLGVCPTPALAFTTAALGFGAGIMVSASHNPADDNGLKVLDGRGLKLDDRVEDELEALLWRADELPSPTNAGLGREVDARAGLKRYVEHRRSLASRTRSGHRVSLDCANGSGCAVAAHILEATGASVSVHFDHPDGVNINRACGATAPAALAAIVAREGSDVGFALDGDADRCVAVDECGRVVDGDQLLGIIALDRLARGRLAGGTLVVSVLSNGGLADVVERAGGRVVRTPVGDKYILDAMLVSGAGVGGEKSGHVIVSEHTTSGDGIVTALEVLDILSRTGRPLSELAASVPLYPQEQRTIAVRHKDQWEADLALVDAVRAAEAELAGHGRILVRPSGTEPALRIMVEGSDPVRVVELAAALAALAGERLN